jgi:hypothetical protein
MRNKIASEGWSDDIVYEIIEEIRRLRSLTMETTGYGDT